MLYQDKTKDDMYEMWTEDLFARYFMYVTWGVWWVSMFMQTLYALSIQSQILTVHVRCYLEWYYLSGQAMFTVFISFNSFIVA